jgi:tetratricopeptide (TPR) repeat protein
MRALRPSLGLLLLLAAVAPGRGGPEAQVQPPKLTGPPEPPWKYRNEEAWIASEITRDIVEMVVYSKDRSLVDSGVITVAAQASPSSPAAPPSFDVSLALDPKAAPVRAVVVLDEHLWSPKSYSGVAQLLLGRSGLNAATSAATEQGSLLGALTDLRARNLERENQRISGMLAANMRDPLAHEQAAFLLGAFGLRDSAGYFSDSRRTLSRMTAHLAMAQALREAAPSSPEGTYAEILLLTLVGRQRDVLDRLAARKVAALVLPAETAWVNALRMRNTHDYRVLAEPSKASLLERLEYFRALSTSLGGPEVLEFLAKPRPETVPDWGRISLQENLGLETGHTFTPTALDAEIAELAELWNLSRGQALNPGAAPSVLAPNVINTSPVRCIARREDGKIRPQALDWGTWADSSQRHLCHALVEGDVFIGRVIHVKAAGAAFREEGARKFGSLRLYPLVSFAWQTELFAARTRSASGQSEEPILETSKIKSEAAACENTVPLFRDAPEIVTVANWDRVFRACFHARSTALFFYGRWFSGPFPPGTAFDLDYRVSAEANDPYKLPPQLEGLLKLAPFQRSLVQAYMGQKYGTKPTLEQFNAAAGPLVDYDRHLMRARANLAKDNPAEYQRLARPLCDLNAGDCLALGKYLADHEMDEAAAHAYQRAFDSAPDRLAVANDSDWLVNYYFDKGEKGKAVAVAQAAAEVYSLSGLQIMGRVLERMGRYPEAESYFKKIQERYDNKTELQSFYIRREQRAPGSGYAAQAATALKELFPQGLVRVSVSDFSTPLVNQDGVLGGLEISQTTGKLVRFGINLYDVIVAIDGYRIRNQDQYLCVRGFTDDPHMRVVVWRAGRYVEIKGLFKRRRFGP